MSDLSRMPQVRNTAGRATPLVSADARLFAVKSEGREHPVAWVGVECFLFPAQHEVRLLRMKRHWVLGRFALGQPDSATSPSTTHVDDSIRETHTLPLQAQAPRYAETCARSISVSVLYRAWQV